MAAFLSKNVGNNSAHDASVKNPLRMKERLNAFTYSFGSSRSLLANVGMFVISRCQHTSISLVLLLPLCQVFISRLYLRSDALRFLYLYFMCMNFLEPKVDLKRVQMTLILPDAPKSITPSLDVISSNRFDHSSPGRISVFDWNIMRKSRIA